MPQTRKLHELINTGKIVALQIHMLQLRPLDIAEEGEIASQKLVPHIQFDFTALNRLMHILFELQHNLYAA